MKYQINDSRNIRYGVILSYLGLGTSIVGSLFISNRVLDYIGDYNYGLYSFVNSITAWLTVLSSALTASFLRYTTIEAKNNSGNVNKTNTLYLKILSMLGLGVTIFGLVIISFLFTRKVNIGNYSWTDSRLMYLLFALSILNIGLTMPASIFSLFINYRKQFIFERSLYIVNNVINFAGHFLIAYFTRNVVIIAAFSILVTIVTLVCNSLFCYKLLNIGFEKASILENRTLVKSIFVFSGILLFNSFVDQVNTNVDKTLLGIFSIPDDITKYQMGQQLASYLTVMSVSVSGVFAPTIHELVANKDQNGLDNLYLKVSQIQTVIICCVAFGFLSCGKDFILWWIGESRLDAYKVCSVLMILNIGPLTMNSSIEIQRAENKHLFRAVAYFILALANITLSIIFLKIFDSKYSIYACLIGTVVTTICSHWIAMNLYNKIRLKLSINKYLFTLVEYMAIGLFCFIGVIFLNNYLLYAVSSNLLRFLSQGVFFVFEYLVLCSALNRKIILEYIKRHFGNKG